jgi:hypothetical protein
MDDLETNIKEHLEGLPVQIGRCRPPIDLDAPDAVERVINQSSQECNGPLVIKSHGECGHVRNEVDLLDVIEWVKANMPELL